MKQGRVRRKRNIEVVDEVTEQHERKWQQNEGQRRGKKIVKSSI